MPEAGLGIILNSSKTDHIISDFANREGVSRELEGSRGNGLEIQWKAFPVPSIARHALQGINYQNQSNTHS